MANSLQKLAIGIIYAGIILSLFVPLFINNGFFFPFITPRAFLFRIVVEIMLLAYLYLAFTNPNFRPRRDKFTLLLSGFLLVAFASSLVGVDFYRSFWGDMERSEGLLLWLHLFAFFIILTNVLREERRWLQLFDFSCGVAAFVSLYGLGQLLSAGSVLSAAGVRVTATFGNAAFLAGYMIFHVAFAAYLLVKRKNRWFRAYYGGLILLFVWIIFATQVRGAIVGLAAGLLFAALALAWTNREHKQVRRISLAVIVAVVAFAALLYIGRQQAWVQDSPTLRRLASISLNDRTVETRIATWKAALAGWKDRFLLGYGMESFNVVFNKNFPPVIYEDEGSVVWFDRAHNTIFDRGVTTGLVGLIFYLSFIFLPFYYLLRYRLKDPDKRPLAVIFSALVVAFFVQNLFVFETIITFIILFFTWAFLASVLHPAVSPALSSVELGRRAGTRIWAAALIVYLLLLGPVVWQANLRPAQVNRAMAVALASDPQKEDFFKVVDRYRQVLSKDTYGLEEYRIQYIDFIAQNLGNRGAGRDPVIPVIEYTDQEVEKQLSEFSNNAKNFLLAMRYYNFTREIIPGQEEARLRRALSFYPRAIELSPTRPHLPQEAGYTYRYLYQYYKNQGRQDDYEEAVAKAEEYFRKALALNPKVVESYVNLIMLYLETGQEQKIEQVVSEMETAKAPFRQERHLNRILDLAKTNKSYQWINFFAKIKTELDPKDPDAWIDVALSYAYLGDRENAIKTAETIKSFGGNFVEEADRFIQQVNSGFFEE